MDENELLAISRQLAALNAERASRDVTLYRGDLIGTGCTLELGPETTDGWLQPGDIIELEIDRLGVLVTPIV